MFSPNALSRFAAMHHRPAILISLFQVIRALGLTLDLRLPSVRRPTRSRVAEGCACV